jgi:hypothetical protein
MKKNVLSVFRILTALFSKKKIVFRSDPLSSTNMHQLNCPFHGRVCMEGGGGFEKRIEQKMAFTFFAVKFDI